MKDLLSVDTTPFLTAGINFESKLNLEEVANLLSKCLAGGAAFGGKEDNIHDEIPCVYIKNFLGGRLVLDGGPGSEGYNLVYEPTQYPFKAMKGKKKQTVDFSGILIGIISENEELRIIL